MYDYLNYCTIYSSSGTLYKKLNKEGDACFSDVFHKLDSHGKYDIKHTVYMYTNEDFIFNEHKNNFCPFTEEEIKFHITYLRFLAPFSYKLSKIINKEYGEAWKLEIKLNAIGFIHKVFLTWIRYLYEYPFTLAVYDALILRKMDKFIRNSNYMNIINFTLSHYSNDRLHQIPANFYEDNQAYIMLPLSRSQFKKNILKSITLNNIYDRSIHAVDIYDIKGYADFEDFKQNFDNRFKIYNEQLNLTK